jgi:hypothetical protein
MTFLLHPCVTVFVDGREILRIVFAEGNSSTGTSMVRNSLSESSISSCIFRFASNFPRVDARQTMDPIAEFLEYVIVASHMAPH